MFLRHAAPALTCNDEGLDEQDAGPPIKPSQCHGAENFPARTVVRRQAFRSGCGLYAYRTAGGHRHHCDSGRDVVARSVRSQCMNNLKQWGVALTLYASDCQDYFPDNSGNGAVDLAWMSALLQTNFYPAYFYPNRPGSSSEQGRSDIICCPTGERHRFYEGCSSKITLIGHSYLPGRVESDSPNW
jgi:hypothetical protein